MKYRLALNEAEYQLTALPHYFFIPLVWVFKDYTRLLKLIIPHPYKRLFTNSNITLLLSPGRGVWVRVGQLSFFISTYRELMKLRNHHF